MLGKKLKIAMINANISQEEFAKKLEVNRALVSQWITGFRNPSMKNLQKISRILKLPISYFIDNKNEENNENSSIKEITLKGIENRLLAEIKKLNSRITSLEKELKQSRK